MKTTAPLLAAALFVVATTLGAQVRDEAAAQVDLRRFAGTWYELARVPNRLQRHCAADVTANYALRRDGRMAVSNRCRRADGSVDVAEGVARVQRGDTSGARLEVSFLPRWLRWTDVGWDDHWVVALDPDYSVAIVSDRKREHLWVLSRSPHLDPDVLGPMMHVLHAAGYAVERLERTPHTGLLPTRMLKVMT